MSPMQSLAQRLDKDSHQQSPANGAPLAAVLVAITRGANPHLLLTRRAAHLNSHSHQVAFPGGKWEPCDASLEATALRESLEEVNLDPLVVEVQGCLPVRVSRWGLEVLPVVGFVPEGVTTRANPEEIEVIFQAPLNFFMDNPPQCHDFVTRQGQHLKVPAWHFEGYEIWGLTALMIDDLLKHLRSA